MGYSLFTTFKIVIFGLIVWAIYLFSKWVLKKTNIGNGKSRKYISLIPIVLLTPVIIFGLFISIILMDSYNSSSSYRSFNEYRWKKDPFVRLKMSPDIIEKKILIGKTRSGVTELLGNDFRRYDENTIVYNLEKYPWYFINDPKILKIHFRNGKVVKVEDNRNKNRIVITETEACSVEALTTESEIIHRNHTDISTVAEPVSK